VKALWFLTILGSTAGLGLLALSFTMSGAPQQGAAAAMGAAFAVIPYVLSRAAEAISKGDEPAPTRSAPARPAGKVADPGPGI